MPLDYAHYAHYYQGQELTEAEKQAHFAVMADFLECIARLFWRETVEANSMGISLNGLSLVSGPELNWEASHLIDTFNDAATEEPARKQES